MLQKIKKLVSYKTSKFTKNENGNLLVTSALLIPVVMLSAVSTLEYSNMNGFQSKMQHAADIAVLATAKQANSLDDSLTPEEQQAELKAYFQSFYNSNILSGRSNANLYQLSDSDFDFIIDPETGEVDIQIDHVYESNALGLLNLNSKPISVAASAQMNIIANNYVIDIVMCLDATGSMQATLDKVKLQALSFNSDLKAALGSAADDIKIRVKPIFYRDWDDAYYYDNPGNRPWWWDYYFGSYGSSYEGGMVEGSFIDLDPSEESGLDTEGQQSALSSFIGSERAAGGFDLPEAAGACLNEGLRSDWFDNQSDEARDFFGIPDSTKIIKSGETPPSTGKYVHVTTIPAVVFWTDASISNLAHSRNHRSASTPTSYPNFEQLWEDGSVIDQERKLLIHFGPDSGTGWNNIKLWDRYNYGGSLSTGNDDSVKVIAEKIKKAIPDLLRVTS